MRLPLTAGATLPGSISPPSKRTLTVPALDEVVDVLPVLEALALSVNLALRVDELELTGRADEVAHLVLVADAGDLDHDAP